MSFIDSNGYPLINEEQKIRITLSDKARTILIEDMEIFGITKPASFINLIFTNFHEQAKSSISLHLQQKSIELNQFFSKNTIDEKRKKIAIEQILSFEEEQLIEHRNLCLKASGESKLYHINSENLAYLTEECNEDQYYKRPGQYIRSVIEEYCSLPFIEREEICKKEIYEIIQKACEERRILKVKARYFENNLLFYVYPYKIVSDANNTQSYLVCYSRKEDENENNKKLVSFSMARINKPTILKQKFYLSKQETANIESQIIKYSPAFLIEEPTQIKVRLTEKGKRSFKARLYSRPQKIDSLSTNDVYVFDCTEQQIFNYFFPFGAEAEIISPTTLRERFIKAHMDTLIMYNINSKE